MIDKQKVYLMPAGENQDLLNDNKEFVVQLAIKNYLNFTTRLHIDIWNKKNLLRWLRYYRDDRENAIQLKKCNNELSLRSAFF